MHCTRVDLAPNLPPHRLLHHHFHHLRRLLLSACAAASLAWGLDGYALGLPTHPTTAGAWLKVIVAEFLATFLFCSLVLYTAISQEVLPTGKHGVFGPVAVGLSGALRRGYTCSVSLRPPGGVSTTRMLGLYSSSALT